MNQSINTKEVAAELADKIDDLVITGEISDQLRDKFTSASRLIKAVNEADIDVCGWLRPNVTAVLFLEAGSSDLMIRRAGSQIDDSSGLPDEPSGYGSLNNFVDYSQLRSSFANVFTEYPLGSVKSFQEVQFVSPTEFDRSAGNYSGVTACIDYYHGRVRFSSSFGTDVYISFQAEVMPLKIPAVIPGRDPLDVYKIRAPHYANELLIHTAIMKLIPKNTQYYSILRSELEAIKMQAYANMPVETGTVQIESTFFDDF